VTIVIDTSIVLAVLDPEDDLHARAVAFYEGLEEDLVTTPMAVAEMDYLATRRAGRSGAELLWENLDQGAVQVRWWATAMAETLAIANGRPALGLTGASLLALAPVVRTTRIASFDHRHLSAARTPAGDRVTLLP